MEFTEIWLRGSACLVNVLHKQPTKCFGIFNRHLIALNIEQMIVIAGILYINTATVPRGKKAHTTAAALPEHLHLFTRRRGATLGGSSINL